MKAFLSVRPLIVDVSRPCHGFHTSDGDSVEGLNGRGGEWNKPSRPHLMLHHLCGYTCPRWSHALWQEPRAIELNRHLLGSEAGQPSGQARHRNHASWLTHCSHGKAGEFHAHPRTNWCPSHPSQHSTAPAIERPTSRFLNTLCPSFILLFGNSALVISPTHFAIQHRWKVRKKY